MRNPFKLPVLAALWLVAPAASAQELLDLAPFARRCCVADGYTAQVAFDYEEAARAGRAAERAADGRWIYGLQWAEERDVSEVAVRFAPGARAVPAEVEYWFNTWPYAPPEMPTIEDPADDPWQGRWLKAAAKVACSDALCTYTFLPLAPSENPRASSLPGLEYRRTLKLRLVFGEKPALERVSVYSGSRVKKVSVRVELGAGETARHDWRGKVRVSNGRLAGLQSWNASPSDFARQADFQTTTDGHPKGLLISLLAAEPALPGSNDVTIVTLEAGERSFSFAVPDVEKGPVYVPAYHAYVTLASDPKPFSPAVVNAGARIRERLAREPEQTYERASREIPPIDPVARQGERLYLPLAADASWQKFAFEWGGNVHVSKRGTKALGAELARLEWPGDRIAWRIGTGSNPDFRLRAADSRLSTLEGSLPLALVDWTAEGIEYREEAFATLLSGPLSPDDPKRSEQAPAVLMLSLVARNPGAQPGIAHVSFATDPAEDVSFENGLLLARAGANAANNDLVRARLDFPAPARVELSAVHDGEKTLRGLHATVALGAGESREVSIAIPFVPRLSPAELAQFKALSFASERARVTDYWREIVRRADRFDVPEQRFQAFAKGLVPRIRISATKDPASGLMMVPAASYYYWVYANEASFQCLLLDALGEHELAAQYLETFVRLQGSKPFAGTFTGDQSAVYHGARVSAERDYTAHQYNLDHGVVLWALGEHYFYTRDKAWFARVAPSMMRAADWIIGQRKLTMLTDAGEEVPEYGLLPAGHLEDNDDWAHWYSVNAFAWAGMNRLAEALADTGSPEAAKYAREAGAYREDIRRSVLAAAAAAPVVRLRDNFYAPYVPTQPHARLRLFGPLRAALYSRYPVKVLPTYRLSAVREVLYGPMILLSTGVFGADEPLADWVLDDWEDNVTMSEPLGINPHGWVDEEYWFSRGGMVFQANLQNPIQVYLRRREVPGALRNLYNDFVACYYPGANVFSEEFKKWGSPSGPFYKVPDEAKFVNRERDLLVREEGDALWLAAGTPRRWLEPGKRIEARQMPTYFGPVSYKIEAGASEIRARVEVPSRNPPAQAWLVLRLPGNNRLRTVEVNGKPWRDFEPESGKIRLPVQAGAIEIVARF